MDSESEAVPPSIPKQCPPASRSSPPPASFVPATVLQFFLTKKTVENKGLWVNWNFTFWSKRRFPIHPHLDTPITDSASEAVPPQHSAAVPQSQILLQSACRSPGERGTGPREWVNRHFAFWSKRRFPIHPHLGTPITDSASRAVPSSIPKQCPPASRSSDRQYAEPKMRFPFCADQVWAMWSEWKWFDKPTVD